MTILALPAAPVNVKSLPAPVVAPINRPRPCDCGDGQPCACDGSGWSVSVDALILAGKPIPADALRKDMEACQRLIRTIDRVQREDMARLNGGLAFGLDDAGEFTEPALADRLWAAYKLNVGDPGHALDEISPETDGITKEYLGLMDYESHRDEERRYLDWCDGR